VILGVDYEDLAHYNNSVYFCVNFLIEEIIIIIIIILLCIHVGLNMEVMECAWIGDGDGV
jgi:hypothetical protein